MSIPSSVGNRFYRGGTPRIALPSAGDSERRRERPRRTKRILFASAHSIVDFSNGASVATLDILEGLTAAGFDCQAFCTAKLDLQTGVCLEDIVSAAGGPHQVRPMSCGEQRARVRYTRRHHVPVTIIQLDSTGHVP